MCCAKNRRCESSLVTSPLIPHILSRFPTQAVLPVIFQGTSALSLSISVLRLLLVQTFIFIIATTKIYLPFWGWWGWIDVSQKAVGIVRVYKLIHHVFLDINSPAHSPGLIPNEGQFTIGVKFDLTWHYQHRPSIRSCVISESQLPINVDNAILECCSPS